MLVVSWTGLSSHSVLLAIEQPVSQKQIDELILQLNADTLSARSRAERQLLESGSQILKYLPATELIDNVSSREAIRRIRLQLERQAAQESSASSRLTIQGAYSLPELFAQIENQSRNRFIVEDAQEFASSPRPTINWNSVPFWKGLDDLCSQTGLAWKYLSDTNSLQIFKLVEPAKPPLGLQYSGPFRVTAETVETRPIVGNDQEQLLRVGGRLVLEPRLRPLFLRMQSSEQHCSINDKFDLIPWNMEAKYEFPLGDGSREATVSWDFRMPVKIPLETLSLKGQLNCQIAAATERIAFSDQALVSGTMRRRGGVTVRLRQVGIKKTEEGDFQAEIGIVVSYENAQIAFESHRSWIYHNAAYLEWKPASRVNYSDFDIRQTSDGAVAVDYRWQFEQQPAEKLTFVYEAPTLLIDVPVRVDLPNIRVPQ